MFEESKNVVSVSHASENGIPPDIGGDSSNTTVGAVENFPIACTPKVPHDYGSQEYWTRCKTSDCLLLNSWMPHLRCPTSSKYKRKYTSGIGIQ